MKPYYQDDLVTIYHGDSKEIVPTLGKFDLLLTDPPYGIKMAQGFGGSDGFRGNKGTKPIARRTYKGKWDETPPCSELLNTVINSSELCIIWGGNYFSDVLPQNNRWLIWDKEQTMPTYSDAELAWTNFSGNAVYMFRYSNNGLLARERGRVHPTQKPLALMEWCIKQADNANRGEVETILDPFAGSGSTGVMARTMGRECVMVEMDERYCEVAAYRLQQGVFDL